MNNLNRFRLPGQEKKYSQEPRNKAFAVIVKTKQGASFLEESLAEMRELVSAANVQWMGHVFANVPDPSPRYFLREGKLTEARNEAKRLGANVLIFNIELSPGQVSNIEVFAGIPAVDRTGLILEIFARRAKTKEGKLQVELAQLSYSLPRIGGLGVVMTRAGGGKGTRGGGGEQELERDRRKVRLRIQRVKEELKDVKQHRELIRAGRKRKRFFTAALVGYTNAGKSTLLNSLTGADSYVENKMFATLDPVARVESINGRDDVLFIDTVGFLRDLPHALVESFHATLEEVAEADVLIHVLDVSHSKAKSYKESVEKVLKEIGAGEKTTLLALNKADLLKDEEKRMLQSEWPDGVLISAKDKLGLNSLLAKLEIVMAQSPTPLPSEPKF